jgi:hypothetical protein
VAELASWNDTATRRAIETFVQNAARDLPEEARVAVFDNDGTLWCEKPMPIELGFILERLAEMAEGDAALRDRQPWKADGGTIVYLAEPDVFDDGPAKPVRIWSRIGRRPTVAGGNSNGDLPMLRFAGGRSRPALRLLVLHDDPQREFAYTAGAERALEQAQAEGWTVVSIKDDWSTVFAASDTARRGP